MNMLSGPIHTPPPLPTDTAVHPASPLEGIKHEPNPPLREETQRRSPCGLWNQNWVITHIIRKFQGPKYLEHDV